MLTPLSDLDCIDIDLDIKVDNGGDAFSVFKIIVDNQVKN